MKDIAFCIISAFILYELSGIIGREMLADKHITGEGKGYCDITFGKENTKSLIVNIQYNIFAPIIYMLLIAGILQLLGRTELSYKAVYIVPCYYVVRGFMITVVTGKAQLYNIKYECRSAIPGIVLAFMIQKVLILSGKEIFPTVEEFRTQLWLVFFAMAYQFCVRTMGRSDAIRQDRVCTKQMKQKYILDKYELFRRKYGKIVQKAAPGDYLQRVIYAIMIYENFNRPITQRWCENVIFLLGRRPMTLGIMQVSTTRFLHNAESIELGCAKIKKSFEEYVEEARKQSGRWYYFGSGEPELCLEKICGDYNGAPDYTDAIKAIFYTLPEPENNEYSETQELLAIENPEAQEEEGEYIQVFGMGELAENIGKYHHIVMKEDYYLSLMQVESNNVFCYTEEDNTVFCIDGVHHMTLSGEDAMIYMGPGDRILFRNCSNIALQNIGFIRQQEQEEDAGAILQFEDCEDVRLEGVECMGRSGSAMELKHCERVKVKNARIHDCKAGAITIEETDIAIENSQLRRISATESRAVICAISSTVKLQEVTFYKNKVKEYLIDNDNSRIDSDELLVHECKYKNICNQKINSL